MHKKYTSRMLSTKFALACSAAALVCSVAFAINDKAFIRHDVDAFIIGKKQEICGKYSHDCYTLQYLAKGHYFERGVDKNLYLASTKGSHEVISANEHNLNMVKPSHLILETLNLLLFVVGFTVFFTTIPSMVSRNGDRIGIS